MTSLPEIHVNPKTIPVLESLGVHVRPVRLNDALWPDCAICSRSVNDCDCDPDAAALALLKELLS